jgi:outer membrane protein
VYPGICANGGLLIMNEICEVKRVSLPAERFVRKIRVIKENNMKKILLLSICCLFLAGISHAQKYAIIDTKYILDKLPEYKNAQKQLDDLANNWKKEIDDMQADLDKSYKEFEAEQVMLSDDLKKKREDQLFNKEKTVRDLQRQRFGYEGDLFKKRQELIQPIQSKVFNAVQKLAVQRGYDFILDKSEGITVIFADPKLEKSDDVLRELGVK